MLQSRGQQLAFTSEMAVQQTVVHPGACGDLTNRRRSRTTLREQLTGRRKDGGNDLFFAERFRAVRNR